MGDGTSDFFGGVLRFVGAVLNALFAGTLKDARWRMYTSDEIGEASMAIPLEIETLTVTSPGASMQQRARDDVTVLQQVDPDFKEVDFLEQATRQYQAYVAADSAMDADAMTAIATSDFVAQYRQRVAQWRQAGEQRVGHDVKILGSTLMNVRLDGSQQAIIVRFSSSGVRFTQDVDSGVATDGSAQTETFGEFATFVRPAGTTTPKSASDGGATHCPSCGAPTTGGAAKCPYCGTQLTSTAANWLIDKISASAYT